MIRFFIHFLAFAPYILAAYHPTTAYILFALAFHGMFDEFMSGITQQAHLARQNFIQQEGQGFGAFLLTGRATPPSSKKTQFPEDIPEVESGLIERIRQYFWQQILPIDKQLDERRIPLGTVSRVKPARLGLFRPHPAIVRSNADRWAWYANPSYGVFMGVHHSVATLPIALYGTESQRNYYLREMRTGKKIGAFALTEHKHGSDAAAARTQLETTAVLRTDLGGQDEWVLNGAKKFITNGNDADVVIVIAQTGDKKSAFIVPTRTPGVRVRDDWEKIGLHGTSTADIVFENVRLPQESLLGEVGQGDEIVRLVMNHGRLGIAAGVWGVAERFLDETSKRVGTRQQHGGPLQEWGSVQERLVDFQAHIYAMESLVTAVSGAMNDDREELGIETAIAKAWNTDRVNQMAGQAVQLHGGLGFMWETAVGRRYTDVRVTTIFEGANEILYSHVIAPGALKYFEKHVWGNGLSALSFWKPWQNPLLKKEVRAVQRVARLVDQYGRQLKEKFGSAREAYLESKSNQSHFERWGKMVAELFVLTAILNRTDRVLEINPSVTQEVEWARLIVRLRLKAIQDLANELKDQMNSPRPQGLKLGKEKIQSPISSIGGLKTHGGGLLPKHPTPTQKIRILIADQPQRPIIPGEIQKLITQMGLEGEVELISEIGETGNQEKLRGLIETYQPAVILVFTGQKALVDPFVVRAAHQNGVKAVIRAGAGFDNISFENMTTYPVPFLRSHGLRETMADLTLRFLFGGLRIKAKSKLNNNATDVSAERDWQKAFEVPLEEFHEAIRQATLRKRGEMLQHHKDVLFGPLSDAELRQLVGALEGKKIGLLGFGEIAQEVAIRLNEIKRLTGVSFEILATSPSLFDPKSDRAKAAREIGGIKIVTPEDLFLESDILSVHTPSIDSNIRSVSRAVFDQRTKPLFLINTARRDIVDHLSLFEGDVPFEVLYGGDVDYNPEITKLRDDNPEKVIITPHLGGLTETAAVHARENMLSALGKVLMILLGRAPPSSVKTLNRLPILPIVKKNLILHRVWVSMKNIFRISLILLAITFTSLKAQASQINAPPVNPLQPSPVNLAADPPLHSILKNLERRPMELGLAHAFTQPFQILEEADQLDDRQIQLVEITGNEGMDQLTDLALKWQLAAPDQKRDIIFYVAPVHPSLEEESTMARDLAAILNRKWHLNNSVHGKVSLVLHQHEGLNNYSVSGVIRASQKKSRRPYPDGVKKRLLTAESAHVALYITAEERWKKEPQWGTEMETQVLSLVRFVMDIVKGTARLISVEQKLRVHRAPLQAA